MLGNALDTEGYYEKTRHALPSQGLQSHNRYNKEMASFQMGNDKSPDKETHSTMEPTEGPSNPMLGIPSRI